jgi:hypothetical protein
LPPSQRTIGIELAPTYIWKEGEAPAPRGEIDYDLSGPQIRVWFTFAPALKELPLVSLTYHGEKILQEQMTQTGGNRYVYTASPARELSGPAEILITAAIPGRQPYRQLRTASLFLVTPEKGGRPVSLDGKAAFEFRPGGLTAPSLVAVEQDTAVSVENLAVLSLPYRLEPAGLFLALPVGFALTIKKGPSLPPHAGLFSQNYHQRWTFVGREFSRDSARVTGTLTSNLPLCLMQDTVPPEVEGLSLEKRYTASQFPRNFSVSIKDYQSGIASDEDILISVDGKWLLNEFDPEENRSAFTIPRLSAGNHRLSIVVTDAVGNRQSVQSLFQVLPR